VEKTGLDIARVRYLVSRLKTLGRIAVLERGVYSGVIAAKQKPDLPESTILEDPIWKHRKTVTIFDLIKKTGLDEKPLRRLIIKLMAQGQIKAVSRNVFKKA
jgi:predicted transcriptional regulator of viral defense system